MIIYVTQKHIDEGIVLNCRKCPVALALQKATGTEWIVSGRYMCFYKKKSFFSFGRWSKDLETPAVVFAKISEYDRHGVMTPFSFELETF